MISKGASFEGGELNYQGLFDSGYLSVGTVDVDKFMTDLQKYTRDLPEITANQYGISKEQQDAMDTAGRGNGSAPLYTKNDSPLHETYILAKDLADEATRQEIVSGASIVGNNAVEGLMTNYHVEFHDNGTLNILTREEDKWYGNVIDSTFVNISDFPYLVNEIVNKHPELIDSLPDGALKNSLNNMIENLPNSIKEADIDKLDDPVLQARLTLVMAAFNNTSPDTQLELLNYASSAIVLGNIERTRGSEAFAELKNSTSPGLFVAVDQISKGGQELYNQGR